MRKGITIFWLFLLFSGVVALFWHYEWIYSLPTPIPESHQVVDIGQDIQVARKLRSNNDKPLFLHFFNPDCPCSRFNIPHFKSLVKQYGDEVTFVIVPMIIKGQEYTDEEIRDKFELNIPVLRDAGVAASCGVYSTPQAVIIDASEKLYYRGNYNRSRYCTDKKSNYAMMALDSLLHHKLNPVFDQLALKAYGCTITSCTK